MTCATNNHNLLIVRQFIQTRGKLVEGDQSRTSNVKSSPFVRLAHIEKECTSILFRNGICH
jgi:hypothetical protein